MKTVEVRSLSLMVPEQTSDTTCAVREWELFVVFNVYPGEPRTRDYPGSPPEVEDVETWIAFPDGKRRKLTDGDLQDLLSEYHYGYLREKAIQQASEEAKEEAECAAEERWERERDEGR